jgi:hypothetical protein
VFTARYALSPYIKQIRFVFKGLIWQTQLWNNTKIRHFRKCDKLLLALSFLPVGAHVSALFPWGGYSWKFVFRGFLKIVENIVFLLKPDKSNTHFRWRRTYEYNSSPWWVFITERDCVLCELYSDVKETFFYCFLCDVRVKFKENKRELDIE